MTYPPEAITDLEYDCIFIGSMTGHDEMIDQMVQRGVSFSKINDKYSLGTRQFKYNILADFSKIVYQNGIRGNTAELGVFQGEYAKRINKSFPDRKLYLFDTFTGFDERDRNDEVDVIKDDGNDAVSVYEACEYLESTTVDIVLEKMEYPEKCVVKKGYFPDTAVGVFDSFVFVSIDVDLYKPTLEGLRFFWDKMVPNGIIIIDDYYGFEGVMNAVNDFIKESGQAVRILPVGDGDNIILCK